MSGNAYLRVARLASHPAFGRDGCLHCPLCPDVFATAGTYDRHVLAHPSLTPTVAYWHLSGRTFEREAHRHGWERDAFETACPLHPEEIPDRS